MYRLIPSLTNRLLLVLSDLEMAAGGPLDDLPSTALVESILDGYDDLDNLPVDLVLNGDIFDFLKTSVEGVYPHHITQDIALQKLERIVAAHGSFFDTLREFIDVSPTRRRIVFLVGNHDQEMCFPEVQEGIRKAVGRKQLLFPGFSWKMGRVWIEHGQQKDSMFAVDPEEPFLVKDNDIILNLPWGSVAVLEAILPLQRWLHHFDRLKPRERIFELYPELKDTLVQVFWKYWTQDYWKGFWSNEDPLKKMTWRMFREITYRFGSTDPNISVRSRYMKKLMFREDIDLLVIGHEHTSHWASQSHKKLLQTGCFRDEYLLSGTRESVRQRLLPKTYAEIWMQDDEILSSSLVELNECRESDICLEETLAEVLPLIHEHIGKPETRRLLQLGRRKEEEKLDDSDEIEKESQPEDSAISEDSATSEDGSSTEEVENEDNAGSSQDSELKPTSAEEESQPATHPSTEESQNDTPDKP